MQDTKNTNGTMAVFSVAITCVLAGGAFGALTNMVNGAVSPYYFQKIMRWNFPDIWSAAVAEGLLEGLLYGAIFSLVFSTGFAVVTRGQAGYNFALSQLLRTISFIVICWLVGGLFAILLISINPDFYRRLFPIAPQEQIEMLKFAWVGGSIWGGLIGGLLSAVLGVVITRNKWHLLTESEDEFM